MVGKLNVGSSNGQLAKINCRGNKLIKIKVKALLKIINIVRAPLLLTVNSSCFKRAMNQFRS